MSKNELRKNIINLRNALSKLELDKKSCVIEGKIIEKIKLNKYDIILSYSDFNGEVETKLINEYALNNGLRLYLPKVTYDQHSIMDFYLVSSLENLSKGYYGILEPSGDDNLFDYEALKENKILMIVPGVGFDKKLYRLGYGKGFYDKFLSNKPLIYKAALSLDIQIIDNIISESHDIKMDEIITETKIYK